MNPRSSLRKALGLLIVLITVISVFTQVRATTWSVNAKRLTSSAFYDGFPALAQTQDKRIWLVWSKEVQGRLKLYRKTSTNLGATWSEEANLTNLEIEGQDQNPSIMQAENETIWVVWTSDRAPPVTPIPDFHLDAAPQNLTIQQGGSDNSTIIVTSLNDFSDAVNLTVLNGPTGVTALFEPSQVVPPPNQVANSTLTLFVDPTAMLGNYTLTVLGSSDHLMHVVNVYLEIQAAGGTGQTSIGLAFPSFNADQSSTQDYEIYYKTSHDNGLTWSKGIQLTDNGVDDLRPAIVQLANGTIMIIFQSYILDNTEICFKTTTDGTTWSNLTQLTVNPAPDKGPSAIKTLDGKIWTVWTSMRTGDYEIFYKVYDGFSWSTDTRLTTSIGYDVHPTIVQAIGGEIFVFWSANTSGTFDIYYNNSTDNGNTWSTKEQFASSDYEDTWPTAVRAHDTKIWVAWDSNEADQPDGNWDIYIKSSLVGDIDGDGDTDLYDLYIVSQAYGTFEGEPDYNLAADVYKDGLVDMRDLRIVGYYLLET